MTDQNTISAVSKVGPWIRIQRLQAQVLTKRIVLKARNCGLLLIRKLFTLFRQILFCLCRISGKHEISNKESIPGPGAYNTSSSTKILNKTMPSTKIGSSKRLGLEFGTETPGPGSYNFAKDKFMGRKSPVAV